MMDTSKIKVWLESIVRPQLKTYCSKSEHLALFSVSKDRGCDSGTALSIFVFSVLSDLLNFDDYESLPDRLEHMTEPQIAEHMNRQLRFIKGSETEDTIGSMLVVFQEDGITQYGATVDPETVPTALRELADRIEKRESFKRN